MQLISALFDAPVPAGMALTALAQEGAAPADLGVWPPLPAIPVPPPAAQLLAEAADFAGGRRRRALWGRPAVGGAKPLYGRARGAILVMARAPDLSAAALVKRLSECSPLGPEAALAWARDGALRYRWSELGQG